MIAERSKPVKPEQLIVDNLAEADLAEADLARAELAEDGYVVRRPKRAKLTAEESLKRMQAFESERMENFVASVRKSKS